jgi:hypothetical protein
MHFISRIIVLACLYNISALAAVTEGRPSRILYPMPVQTVRVAIDPVYMAPEYVSREEKIHQEFNQLRNWVVENNLTYYHLANSLKTVLSQVLDNDENADQETKKDRAQAWLKSVDRLLKDPTLFTDKSGNSKNFRNKFFAQLQLALRLMPSEDLVKTKRMIINALTGK